MAFRIRKAMGALVLMVLAAAALLGVGCGGGDDSGSERAVQWGIDRQLGPKSIRLGATVGVCFAPVQFEQPIIEFEDDRVYIELRHTPEDEKGICLGKLLTLRKAITLERDLDELVIFDSSTDPPEQRWPTERPLPPERRWPAG